jgi:transposase
VPQEVTGQEPSNPKDVQIQQLQADKEQLRQENKLLKEKVDLLIRRLFGVKSEKLDAAQLELLLKEADLGKADASAEKAEAAPINELSKPLPKREAKKERRERWPQDLPVEVSGAAQGRRLHRASRNWASLSESKRAAVLSE